MGKNKLDHVHDQVIMAYQNGHVLDELAKAYNVSTGTVRNLLLNYNEPLRGRGRRKNGTNKQANESNPIRSEASV